MDSSGNISNLYLVDTHALFWYLVNSPRLSDLARQVFRRAFAGEALLVLSPIVLLELYGLAQKVKAPLFAWHPRVARPADRGHSLASQRAHPHS